MSGKIGDSAATFKIADPVVLKIADPPRARWYVKNTCFRLALKAHISLRVERNLSVSMKQLISRSLVKGSLFRLTCA